MAGARTRSTSWPARRSGRCRRTCAKRRDELELRVFELRDARERLGAEAYYARLEPLLVELARIYQRAERGR
jgi:hypothetical protein